MARPGALVVCGGTDVYPAHVGRPIDRPLVDLSRIGALCGITRTEGYIRIGATTTWSDISRADLPPAFDGLRAAAREVGSVQIQNRGTIGGNLCNASPAADGVPPLLALDAEVELMSGQGRRVLPLSRFITGYRKTARQEDEIVTAILVPEPTPLARSAFVKLGARRYLVISVIMAAACLEIDGQGRIIKAAVAVGAASPVALRLPQLERDLLDLAPGRFPSSIVGPHHMAALSPIDDMRASASYRMDAARQVVADVLDRAASGVRLG